ncbi:ATP-dependent endonuclease [Vibrio crassostreae]|uniref:ATP-dependent endonuclease n=1 Tax=Vibrio crassostreae TaxID=246167 RepID=UPI001051D13D|nr:ATP-dependent endonuclease [Vibrio crassostreae]TCN96254.1 putative ATP-dependent endonuclease of OLD family [Vibrio crassostreae]CAK1760831.1 putative ATP-dependent endonuclease of the OLD family [Vibrio crassostreae]CAK2158152.1 putative ATP-dependent endonuclease of the OLD family [Vibrio crassostreae]CAK2556815.1 putative ATP-dependent endonuclease of the OLD family [Vibrio crassostreae]CAK2620065.1 putative ATP-dependent endonuclease of the OLD family [Vibrio crassostreae]
MQLERIEISGFRGIKRMSLAFDELTTLIGENTWGKSSLLDALSVVLPSDGVPYHFEMTDFHVDYSVSHPQSQHLQIVLALKASDKSELNAGRYRKLKPIWVQDEFGTYRIYYRISATLEQYETSTHYAFLGLDGNPLKLHHSEKLAQELMTLHPVIRLRDARHFDRPFNSKSLNHNAYLHTNGHSSNGNGNGTNIVGNNSAGNGNGNGNGNNGNGNGRQARIEKRIDNTCRRLMAIPGHVNKGEMHSSLESMQSLIEHYFSFKSTSRRNPRKQRDGLLYSAGANDKSIHQLVEETKNKQTRLLFMGLLNAYLQAKGPADLRRCARPLLILEDPEGRLHPTHLARAWSLMQKLPMQKILTTNSGDLLAAVPLQSIRRLVRQSDKTIANQLNMNHFSKDELRRIGFHIRFHRSGALFARCWLLVEGETEVWLFNELANQCGYNLAAEGVQIIEFAQSGLKALIKVAQEFGIDWHVVTDGDAAGKKYAATVLSKLGNDQERHRLTELPDKDIEHYLYMNGFENFFRDMVKIPYDHPIPPKKVVAKVLKKHAKPDLALAIVSHCENQGQECIPLLLRWTLKRVITMANGNT